MQEPARFVSLAKESRTFDTPPVPLSLFAYLGFFFSSSFFLQILELAGRPLWEGGGALTPSPLYLRRKITIFSLRSCMENGAHVFTAALVSSGCYFDRSMRFSLPESNVAPICSHQHRQPTSATRKGAYSQKEEVKLTTSGHDQEKKRRR